MQTIGTVTGKYRAITGKTAVFISMFVLSTMAGTREAGYTVNVDFTRIKTAKSGNDTVKGTLYRFENNIAVRVTWPIAQFMVIDSTSTLIFNPNERAAFKILSRGPSALPLFQLFLGFFQSSRIAFPPDFKIGASVTKNDSLVTSWIPAEKKSPFQGRFETIYCKDRPVLAATYDKKGNIFSEIRFLHDSLVSGRHIPLRISSMTMQNSDTLRESIHFFNLETGKDIPLEIRNFQIPPGIPVKVMEW